MTFRVQLTFRAESDVDHILQFLKSHSPQGAANWARRWNEILGELAQSARQKPIAPENEQHVKEIRHVVFKTPRGKPYRAIFTIEDEFVFITHVRGPGQDIIKPEEWTSD